MTASCAWYLSDFNFAKLHWFAPSSALRSRLMRLVHQYDLHDFMYVSPLPPGQDYLPGVKRDTRSSRAGSWSGGARVLPYRPN